MDEREFHDRNVDPAPLPEVVVCFDRDHAVSVNPHPDHGAVPLSWVKHLAHERDDVHVWATGNQRLCEEAVIPGISEAITCWRAATLPNDIERYHEYVPPQARKPGRREGLRLVRAIYEAEEGANVAADSIRFLVVDDVDLSDLEGESWTHYFPWEFVTAVEDGTAPIEIPLPLENLTDIPVTDSDCPESFPPLEYDRPEPCSFLFTDE